MNTTVSDGNVIARLDCHDWIPAEYPTLSRVWVSANRCFHDLKLSTGLLVTRIHGSKFFREFQI
jgi:hypothetical protein